MKLEIKQLMFTLSVASLVGMASNAHAQQCGLGTLFGTYSTVTTGLNPTPTAAVDVMTFDGQGNLSITGTTSQNGVISRRVGLAGSYSVNADCTGSWLAVNGAAFDLVIIGQGSEVVFIGTNGNTIVTGQMKHQ